MRTVIVGSGLAGAGLALEMRRLGARDAITIITSESAGYYSRPLLSHGFADEGVLKRALLKSWDDLASADIAVRARTRVVLIDRLSKALRLVGSEGEEDLPYDRLVLATGSAAFVPVSLMSDERAVYVLNGWDDLVALRSERSEMRARGVRPHWGVVGGGFIGCEVASDLAKAGDEVTLFNGDARLMARVFSPEESERLRLHLQGMGVSVRNGVRLGGITRTASGDASGGARVALREVSGGDGKETVTPFDALLLATGFRPRSDLARACGLGCAASGAILVNARFETTDPAIFALGDVAAVEGVVHPFVAPIRAQVKWLAERLAGGARTSESWAPGTSKPKLKVHGFQ